MPNAPADPASRKICQQFWLYTIFSLVSPDGCSSRNTSYGANQCDFNSGPFRRKVSRPALLSLISNDGELAGIGTDATDHSWRVADKKERVDREIEQAQGSGSSIMKRLAVRFLTGWWTSFLANIGKEVGWHDSRPIPTRGSVLCPQCFILPGQTLALRSGRLVRSLSPLLDLVVFTRLPQPSW